jgi:hypothetical protein
MGGGNFRRVFMADYLVSVLQRKHAGPRLNRKWRTAWPLCCSVPDLSGCL